MIIVILADAPADPRHLGGEGRMPSPVRDPGVPEKSQIIWGGLRGLACGRDDGGDVSFSDALTLPPTRKNAKMRLYLLTFHSGKEYNNICRRRAPLPPAFFES